MAPKTNRKKSLLSLVRILARLSSSLIGNGWKFVEVCLPPVRVVSPFLVFDIALNLDKKTVLRDNLLHQTKLFFHALIELGQHDKASDVGSFLLAHIEIAEESLDMVTEVAINLCLAMSLAREKRQDLAEAVHNLYSCIAGLSSILTHHDS